MKRILITILLALFLSAPTPIYAKRDAGKSHQVTRPKRSKSAKRAFMRKTGYPHGRKGYEVDHVTPLFRGGADHPDNMQWLTKKQHRKKTAAERERP